MKALEISSKKLPGLDHVIHTLATHLPVLTCAGFVARDTISGVRMTFKSPQYSSLKDIGYWDHVTPVIQEAWVLQLIKCNDHEEFLHFDNGFWFRMNKLSFLQRYHEARTQFRSCVERITTIYEQIVNSSKSDQEFAKKCKQFPFEAVMFVCKNFKLTPREYFSWCPFPKFMKCLKLIMNHQ